MDAILRMTKKNLIGCDRGPAKYRNQSEFHYNAVPPSYNLAEDSSVKGKPKFQKNLPPESQFIDEPAIMYSRKPIAKPEKTQDLDFSTVLNTVKDSLFRMKNEIEDNVQTKALKQEATIQEIFLEIDELRKKVDLQTKYFNGEEQQSVFQEIGEKLLLLENICKDFATQEDLQLFQKSIQLSQSESTRETLTVIKEDVKNISRELMNEIENIRKTIPSPVEDSSNGEVLRKIQSRVDSVELALAGLPKEEKIEYLSNKIVNLEQKIENFEDLNSKYEDLQQKSEYLLPKIENLEKENQKFQTDSSQTIILCNSNYNSLKESNEQFQKELSIKIEEEHKRMQAQFEEFVSLKLQAIPIIDPEKVGALQTQIEKNNEKITVLENQQSESDEKIRLLEEENKSIKSNLENANKLIVNLENNPKNSEEILEEKYSEEKRKSVSMHNNNDKLSTEISCMKTSIEGLSMENEELRSLLIDFNNKNEKHQISILQIEQSIKDVVCQQDELRANFQTTNLESIEALNMQLKDSITKQERSLNELKNGLSQEVEDRKENDKILEKLLHDSVNSDSEKQKAVNDTQLKELRSEFELQLSTIQQSHHKNLEKIEASILELKTSLESFQKQIEDNPQKMSESQKVVHETGVMSNTNLELPEKSSFIVSSSSHPDTQNKEESKNSASSIAKVPKDKCTDLSNGKKMNLGEDDEPEQDKEIIEERSKKKSNLSSPRNNLEDADIFSEIEYIASPRENESVEEKRELLASPIDVPETQVKKSKLEDKPELLHAASNENLYREIYPEDFIQELEESEKNENNISEVFRESYSERQIREHQAADGTNSDPGNMEGLGEKMESVEIDDNEFFDNLPDAEDYQSDLQQDESAEIGEMPNYNDDQFEEYRQEDTDSGVGKTTEPESKQHPSEKDEETEW